MPKSGIRNSSIFQNTHLLFVWLWWFPKLSALKKLSMPPLSLLMLQWVLKKHAWILLSEWGDGCGWRLPKVPSGRKNNVGVRQGQVPAADVFNGSEDRNWTQPTSRPRNGVGFHGRPIHGERLQLQGWVVASSSALASWRDDCQDCQWRRLVETPPALSQLGPAKMKDSMQNN